MQPKKDLENDLETTYKTTIRYKCPKRGWVVEEVEVKRYKSIAPPEGKVLDTEEVPLISPEEIN